MSESINLHSGSERFLFRLWGDEGVVYDTRTGDTHLLGSVALAMLQLLQQSPPSLSKLAGDLSELAALSPEVDVLALTEATLQQLRRIGLTSTNFA